LTQSNRIFSHSHAHVVGLVGCGGMGLRHLYGLQALQEVAGQLQDGGFVVTVPAVCDSNLDNADFIADNAAKLLGYRPEIFATQAEMLVAHPEITEIDITTGSASHHHLVIEALEAKKHVLVEKPLAATVLGCNLSLEAARKSGKVLAVAENVRRDPLNRLVKALLQDGAIGQPYLIVDYIATGGDSILLTPWRHQQETGGILLDVGVHSADLMRYYLGDIISVSGLTRLLEKTRFPSPDKAVVSEYFYKKWLPDLPDKVEATAEDLLVGHFQFAGGAVGQWTIMQAAHGDKRNMRLIYGSQGILELPPDRSGGPVVLRRDDLDTPLKDEGLLDYAPSYRLDPLTIALFGESRPVNYRLSFEGIDRRLVAIELADFFEAVATGKRPEVDGEEGRKAVALVYSFFESGFLGRSVTLDEVEADQGMPFQKEVNAILGLT
jgi:predicted dehydrogenase